MSLECSQCQNKELNFQPLSFNVVQNQPRTAFGLTCTKCGHVEELIKVKAPQKRASPVDMRNYVNIVDYNELKARYENLVKKLASINIKVNDSNSLGNLVLEPIDQKKVAGIIDPKIQQQQQNSQTPSGYHNVAGTNPKDPTNS